MLVARGWELLSLQEGVTYRARAASYYRQFKNSSLPNYKSNALITSEIESVFGGAKHSISRSDSVSLGEEERWGHP